MKPRVQYPTQRLEEIVSHCSARLQAAMDERVSLGMNCPDNFKVVISLYDNRAMAYAKYREEGSILNVNVIPIVLGGLTEEERSKANAIYDYFDYVREVFPQITETGILKLLKGPEAFLESEVNPEYIEEQGKFFATRGTPIEDYLTLFRNGAKPTRGLIEELLPRFEELFLGSEIDQFRHELDHIDYFPSQKWQEYYAKAKELGEAHQRFSAEGTQEQSRELARTNRELLELTSDAVTEMEIRALYFSNVPVGAWDDVDLDAAGFKAYKHYLDSYIMTGMAEDFLNCIMSQHWASGERSNETMRATSNHVYHLVLAAQNHPGADRYRVLNTADIGMVDFELVRKVVEEELPGWQAKFMDKASFYAEELKPLFSQKEDS